MKNANILFLLKLLTFAFQKYYAFVNFHYLIYDWLSANLFFPSFNVRVFILINLSLRRLYRYIRIIFIMPWWADTKFSFSSLKNLQHPWTSL